ncbi:hypothetical protein QF035_001804 [Streptomyces umbrinus]|uniref:Uncharacterized protein n=1 Tax=Streptomyces umbrinus TaxID=67370 RepID=A0ABU0SLA8_9ACTN|nr:hypothetical protein [Streptomyces umbrinus]
MGFGSGATERAGNAQQVDVRPGVEAYAMERGGLRGAAAGHGSRRHVRHLRPSGPADLGSGRPRVRGPSIGHRLVVNEHNSTAVPFLPATKSSCCHGWREFLFLRPPGVPVRTLLITRCEAGLVVRRPDAQLLRRRLDGHAERINTDGDGHDCQRPSCGDSPFVRSSAPARWQATLPPRRGAPGDDRVPPERRGKRGLASREPRRQDRWELSRNGLTRRLHIDLSRVSSAY